MTTWDRLRTLPVAISQVSTETLELAVGDWLRKTTVISLSGGGETGVGEDVTYDAAEHDRFPTFDLSGDWTLESLSDQLDTLALFETPPAQAAYLDYRRWAIESAALDLALRQAAATLAARLQRTSHPVHFVSSTRAEDLDPWLALYPNLRFKLDPTSKWPDELITKRAAAGNVDTLDLKGAYHGTSVDNPADPKLYKRVLAAFPAAWIEDPELTTETWEMIEGHRARVTWDAPIHSWADVESLPFTPRCLNSKPSRFGSLARLFEFYDRCAEEGIGLYGGGQFELGPGRGQIQLLASIFHPRTPNDVAPGGYNGAPVAGLPTSPLRLVEQPGFRA